MGIRTPRLPVIVLALFFAFAHQGWAQTPAIDREEVPSDEPKKSYIIPALEILGFDVALNRFGYRFDDREAFNIGWSSIRRNLKRGWVVDHDEFKTNQF